MVDEYIDITPSTRILRAIIHNPIKPIDALCELIDNSIDGFSWAEKHDIEIENPTVWIELPKRNEVDNGVGKITVKDNGPGLSIEDARKAVTAGYSGNPNPLDNMGLFGMGFNISTGKLGQRTIFTTTRKGDKDRTSIIIDLPSIIENEKFSVPVEAVVKPNPDESETTITIDKWYPEDDNLTYGFIQKLTSMTKRDIRDRLGRIYSSILGKKIKIIVDGEECVKFHHCVWAANRSVSHREIGIVPAQYPINQVVGTENRCDNCWHIMEASDKKCESCGAEKSIRVINKTVTGWIGIQRFDDKDNFGIDLIRNGRTIRTWEKDAFFVYEDEDGNKTREYPVDSIYGRIVGELHIDFVPVDYLKSDFQRTSQEWLSTIECVRGKGSLLPRTRMAHNEGENDSPLYKLVQAYRRVREFGSKELYMGSWDPISRRASRIDRKIEKEYYEKFKTGAKGFGFEDDEEWWKLVEAADPQSTATKECPQDLTQNALTAETCLTCGYIFLSKKCIHCGDNIPRSAFTCDKCGIEQVTETKEWKCAHCNTSNTPEREACIRCNVQKGNNPLDLEYLKDNSTKIERLSVENFSIPLPGGSYSEQVKLSVYGINEDANILEVLPLIINFSSSTEIFIFFNQSHPAINAYQDRPEDYISLEMARYIQELNISKINDLNRHEWSISNLYFLIHTYIWKNHINLNPSSTKNNVKGFFEALSNSLPVLLKDEAEPIFDELEDHDQAVVLQELIRSGVEVARIEDFKKSGKYLVYLPPKLIIKLIEKYPENFFDGSFWKEGYANIPIPDDTIRKEVREEILQKYISCLNDLQSFLNYRKPEVSYTQKINQTLSMMNETLVND
jgi:hypothetical protein